MSIGSFLVGILVPLVMVLLGYLSSRSKHSVVDGAPTYRYPQPYVIFLIALGLLFLIVPPLFTNSVDAMRRSLLLCRGSRQRFASSSALG
jgi:hypothetical protein